MSKFVVLLSGGLDSVVNLHEAHGAGKVLLALTFDYGQKAVKSEVKAAQYFCEKLNIPHEVIEIPWLKKLTKTALVSQSEALPSLKNLDDMQEAGESAKAVWVPNRNGAFLNIAACYAESLGAEFIIPGFNKEEAATFPDNSQDYINALNISFSFSTMSQVKVKCFTTDLDKTEMVRRAQKLNVDLSRVWSCYRNESKPCGSCESCQRSIRAFKAVGINP